jgi:hypothetical protein
LLNSTLTMSSTSLMEYVFIMITNSSANVTAVVWLVHFKLRRELYCMFQKIGPAAWNLWKAFGNIFLHFTTVNWYYRSSFSTVVLCKSVEIQGAFGVS